MDHAPQLTYDSSCDLWALWLQRPGVENEQSFVMYINYQWDGESWSHYTFGCYDMGDFTEILTQAEYNQRIVDIEEHEGSESAKLWRTEQDVVDVQREDHPVFELRKHWEALMQLNLFVPQVTHFGHPPRRALNKDLIAKMNLARNNYVHDQYE